jgi:glucoamylase
MTDRIPSSRCGGLPSLVARVLLTVLPFAAPPLAAPAFAQTAPNGPGASSVWATAAKEFVGTSYEPVASGGQTPTSCVYFTGAEGILTEVFYPTLDCVQNVDLQLLVVDRAKTFQADEAEERKQTNRQVKLVDKRALLWQVVTTSKNGKWRTTKRFFSDPKRNSVIERVEFETLEAGKTVSDYDVYVLNNPAINNTGGGGRGAVDAGQDNSQNRLDGGRTYLLASEPHSTSSALGVSLDWQRPNGAPATSHGFVGTNDGFSDLFGVGNDRTMDSKYTGAFGGNVAQMGLLDFNGSTATTIEFAIVLSFGASEQSAAQTAAATLGDNLDSLELSYLNGWKGYTGGLNSLGSTADDQYYLCTMCLKASQDKSNGAMVAGMGTPWGEDSHDGNFGYHMIWARDLFKFSSALLSAGDKASANAAVEFLFNRQMQRVDADSPVYSRIGRFPQISFVDGTPHSGGEQLDETAMPIILAYKLKRFDLWHTHIKSAAEFLSHRGPRTNQERWEEVGGYSPSTIAAEIAGLVCAASLATDAHDQGAATFYLQAADEWRNQVSLWTFTTTGFHGDKKYYIRITDNDDPNDDNAIDFKNGSGSHGERYIIDGGFLELVRLGVMSPSDWTIRASIPEYDQILRRNLPGIGDTFFRYNYDGYGETNSGARFDGNSGRGRLWPIFTAERGIYEISLSGTGSNGKQYRDTLLKLAGPTGLISEQVWNPDNDDITGWRTNTPAPYVVGTATKSMRPLNWAMGEYINLMVAIQANKGDAPDAVVSRYRTDLPQATVTIEATVPTASGEEVYLLGPDPLLGGSVPTSGVKLNSKGTYPKWTATISLPAGQTFQYQYAKLRGRDVVTWPGGLVGRMFTVGAAGTSMTQKDTP